MSMALYLGLSMFFYSSVSGASIVTLTGTTISISYDDQTIDPVWGSVNISGDSIFFTPTNFTAIGDQTISSVINFKIEALPGYEVTDINWAEIGDWYIDGSGTVQVQAFVRVYDFDDPVPLFGTEETHILQASGLTGETDGVLRTWQIQDTFDLQTSLLNQADIFGVTLQNTITSTGDGFASKKSTGFQMILETVVVPPTPVPPPGSFVLLLSGLIFLFSGAKKCLKS